MGIRENVEAVKERIGESAVKANRNPEDIVLIAVTKTVDENRILEAIDAGIQHIGENRVQELREKYDKINRNVKWHMIGTLQTNKVKYIIDKIDMIHSVDRLSLVCELEKRAEKIGRKVPVLIQVNVSKEDTKSGVYEEELIPFVEEVIKFPHLKIQGLMTIAPYTEDPERTRPYFARLRELFEDLKDRQLPGVEMRYLSMGMTNDFEIAVQEGANMLRIGRAIFGERPK